MVGDRIRWLRERARLTQADLAEQINMSEQSVLRWENGKTKPSIEEVRSLARFFNVTGDYLLELSDDPRGNMTTELSQREWDIIQALRQSDFSSFTQLLAEDLKERG